VRPLLSVLALSATLAASGPAVAACYALERDDMRSGQARREAQFCADREIDARRQCRRVAEGRNEELLSREPFYYRCRPAR
jgi:hypothetical protein